MSVALPIGRTSKPRPSECKRMNVLERLFLHPVYTLGHLRARTSMGYISSVNYMAGGKCVPVSEETYSCASRSKSWSCANCP